jgi:Zn-finger nucleic acid-binding protein
MTSLRCPRCRTTLFRATSVTIEIHGCEQCGGIWLDKQSGLRLREELDARALAIAEGTSLMASQEVDTQPLGIPCPACGVALERSRSKVAPVDLDSCRSHGTWFDRTELERVVQAIRQHKSRPAGAGAVGAVAVGGAAVGALAVSATAAAAVLPGDEVPFDTGVASQVGEAAAEGAVHVAGEVAGGVLEAIFSTF